MSLNVPPLGEPLALVKLEMPKAVRNTYVSDCSLQHLVVERKSPQFMLVEPDNIPGSQMVSSPNELRQQKSCLQIGHKMSRRRCETCAASNSFDLSPSRRSSAMRNPLQPVGVRSHDLKFLCVSSNHAGIM